MFVRPVVRKVVQRAVTAAPVQVQRRWMSAAAGKKAASAAAPAAAAAPSAVNKDAVFYGDNEAIAALNADERALFEKISRAHSPADLAAIIEEDAANVKILEKAAAAAKESGEDAGLGDVDLKALTQFFEGLDTNDAAPSDLGFSEKQWQDAASKKSMADALAALGLDTSLFSIPSVSSPLQAAQYEAVKLRAAEDYKFFTGEEASDVAAPGIRSAAVNDGSNFFPTEPLQSAMMAQYAEIDAKFAGRDDLTKTAEASTFGLPGLEKKVRDQKGQAARDALIQLAQIAGAEMPSAEELSAAALAAGGKAASNPTLEKAQAALRG